MYESSALQSFVANAAWYRTQAIACGLIAWLRLLGCDHSLARAEPATLRRESSTAASPIPCCRTGLLDRNFR